MIWYVLDMMFHKETRHHSHNVDQNDDDDVSNEIVDLKIDFHLKWELMDLRCNLSLFSQVV